MENRVAYDRGRESTDQYEEESAQDEIVSDIPSEELYPYGHCFIPTLLMERDELDPPAGTCHNCWSPYHRRADCQDPQRKYCKNCGRKNIDIADCPRCGQEYPEWKEKDRARRREKNKLMREGKWERDTTVRRGTHLSPYQIPSSSSEGAHSSRTSTRRTTQFEDYLTQPSLASSSLLASSHSRSTIPPVMKMDKGQTNLRGRVELMNRPTISVTPAEPPEEIPFWQQVLRVMHSIKHLPVEMQTRIIEPMIQGEEDRVRSLNRSKRHDCNVESRNQD